MASRVSWLYNLKLHVCMTSFMFVLVTEPLHGRNIQVKIMLHILIAWIVHLRCLKGSTNYNMHWHLHWPVMNCHYVH